MISLGSSWHPTDGLAMLLLFVVAVVAGTVDPAVAAVGRITTSGHHPPLLDCGPAPILSKTADAKFRGNLASALAALPAAVAADREAFAAVHAGTSRPGSALARGACFGANVSSSPAAARACEACLSSAARDVLGRCGASSGRAGVWRAACFLSYADSNASTAREQAFRAWFYAGPRSEATLRNGECIRDRAVHCGRCYGDSVRAAAALGWWHRLRGEEVIVVGYSCFARIRISFLPWGPDDETVGRFVFGMWMKVMVETAAIGLGLMFIRIVKITRALPQVNNG